MLPLPLPSHQQCKAELSNNNLSKAEPRASSDEDYFHPSIVHVDTAQEILSQ